MLDAKGKSEAGLFDAMRIDADGLTPAAHIHRVLEIVRTHLDMDVGFVSEFVDGRRVFRHVDSGVSKPPIAVNGSDPLDESYCQRIVDGRLPELMPDACQVPAALAMPVTKELPVGAHISVPLRMPDGRLFGTFCCFSFTPDMSLNDRDLRIMRAFAAIVADLIHAELDLEREYAEKHARIEAVIAESRFQVRFQPIYRLSDDNVAAFEALARFTDQPYRTPDIWFGEAQGVGLGADLEIAVVRNAVEALHRLPQKVMLSVNFSPSAILSPEFGELFNRQPLDRLILEVTEHAAVANYTELAEALRPFRARGLKLAVDDAGAGHASFRHVLDLRPDTIKLDMSLTRNIDGDRGRQALAGALAMFGRAMGSQIVAEGVETQAELQALRTVGVTKVQGYLVGKPVPLTEAVQLTSMRSPVLAHNAAA